MDFAYQLHPKTKRSKVLGGCVQATAGLHAPGARPSAASGASQEDGQVSGGVSEGPVLPEGPPPEVLGRNSPVAWLEKRFGSNLETWGSNTWSSILLSRLLFSMRK